jgi:hypothetical protein
MTVKSLLEAPANAITVSLATTAAEKMKIYRFRYRVYVEEMAMQLLSANHNKKLVRDEMDEKGLLLYATVGSEIVGTQRINIGTPADFPPDLVQILSLDRFQRFFSGHTRQTLAYTSKLMVAQPYRNSAVLHLLTTKGYEMYCHYRVPFNFGVCNFHLLRLYEQFGCRRYGRNFTAPGYDGVLSPFVLLVDDIDHLRAVRSPFYRLARKRGMLSSGVTEWFHREFTEHSEIINSQLITEEDFWVILYRHLRYEPHLVIPVLHGLSALEARKLLHSCGIIIPCRTGEHIVICNQVSHTLTILLSGKLSTNTLPGQCFGAVGLVDETKNREDIFAVNDAQLLVLSQLSFQKFRHTHPDIAYRVLKNLTIRV